MRVILFPLSTDEEDGEEDDDEEDEDEDEDEEDDDEVSLFDEDGDEDPEGNAAGAGGVDPFDGGGGGHWHLGAAAAHGADGLDADDIDFMIHDFTDSGGQHRTVQARIPVDTYINEILVPRETAGLAVYLVLICITFKA